MSRTSTYALVFTLFAAAGRALADTPAFDRPGIAFSTSTIPRGSFAVELGMPDFLHESDAGHTSTLVFLDTNVRTGLGKNIELQLATPVFNYQKTKATGASDSATGLGDSSLVLKAALPSTFARFSWAGLAGVTFATGQDPFTAGRALYSLAAAASLELSDTYSTGFYINLNYSDGRTGYTLSPNLNFLLSDHLSAYVEAGYDHVPQSPDTNIAGGGLAWMVAPAVQLDLSVDFGLTRDSPDFQGGFGVSMFIK